MGIDWGKAPEGTEAGSEESYEQYACWYKLNQWGEVMVIIAGSGIDWLHMGGRRDFPYGSILKPKNS